MNLPSITAPAEFDDYFESPVWDEAAQAICQRHEIGIDALKRCQSSDHIVFSVGDLLMLKIFRPSRQCFERETKALEFVHRRSPFNTPEIVHTGQIDGFDYIVMTQISGMPMTRAEFLALPENDKFRLVSELAFGLKQIHELEARQFNCDWAEFIDERADTFIERQIAHGVNLQIIESLPAFIDANFKTVPRAPTVFLHGDVHFGNLRFNRSNAGLQISGLFDFADSRRGFHEYDFLAVGILMLQGQRNLQREFFRAYGYAEADLDEAFRRRLMMLTMLYETSDLRRYAIRLHPDAVHFTLDQLEKAIWSFA